MSVTILPFLQAIDFTLDRSRHQQNDLGLGCYIRPRRLRWSSELQKKLRTDEKGLHLKQQF
jgi:hypothetical protein